MTPDNEARTLRRRMQAVETSMSNVSDGTRVDGASFVGITTTIDTYPTVAQSYFGVFPVRLRGEIHEGTAPDIDTGTNPVLVLNMGTGIPPEGTYVICFNSGGRYTMREDGLTLVPMSITSNVTAGSEAAPSTFSATQLVASGSSFGWTGSGGTSITGYNRAAGISFSASVGSPKSAWGVLLQGVVYLVSADC